jgi:hypothetical protein
MARANVQSALHRQSRIDGDADDASQSYAR